MRYPGGKNHGSSYPRIINQIPPHHTFIEPFAGSAAIARFKRPAERTVLIDLDAAALGNLTEAVPAGTELIEANALEWLTQRGSWLGKAAAARGTVIYLDPPYLADVCASPLRYDHVLTRLEHQRLLQCLNRLCCPVLISGYRSGLYARYLSGWRLITWPQVTRGGTIAEECLWMNYDQPLELHDYRYLGSNFRERQDVKRQQRRWAAKLAKMSTLRRQALLSVLAGGLGESADEDLRGVAADSRSTGGATPDIAAAKMPMRPGRASRGS